MSQHTVISQPSSRMEHYDEIVRAREAIRKKFNTLRRGESETSQALEKQLKPIAEPLREIVRMKKGEHTPLSEVKKEEVEEFKTENVSDEEGEAFQSFDTESDFSVEDNVQAYVDKRFGRLAGPYFHRLIKESSKGKSRKSDFDHIYGIRHGGGTVAEWMVGDKPVSFEENDNFFIGGEPSGQVTTGLLELLFMKKPARYTAKELSQYKEILEKTNVHRRAYFPDNAINSSNSKKYTGVIRKLFPPKVIEKKKGGTLFVPLTSRKTYIYWDDPNELVERLSLLIASKEAGNTGLEREILSIEEELREGGYIA